MPTVSYRCVCGETIPLDTVEGGSCSVCERRYAADVLRGAFAETVRFDDEEQVDSPDVVERSADQRVGRTFGHYEIVSRLGRGGMGTVYRALDKSLQRYVALKVIRPGKQAVSDTRQLQRLFQEAIAQARVNHPNVVHIYHVGREGDSPFLAMELVDGVTLGEKLDGGSLPFEQVIEIALQIVDALKHSVSFDILHGDIKPGNILLTSDGAVKLSDFGLARRLSQTTDAPTDFAGTPSYMAPEAVEPSSADVRSDMYSLGVTLFEMAFGRLPYTFDGSSISDWINTHRESPIEFPDPWPAENPQRFRHVLEKLLAKSPEDRYQGYDELLADLRELRPEQRPKAGRVQRGLAWFIDLALANTVLQILSAPVLSIEWGELRGRPVVALVLPILVLLVGVAGPLLAAAIQTYWGTTPGKKLFQIRIVDRHGLRPTQPTLAARVAFQMLPLAPAAVTPVEQVLGGVGLLLIAVLIQLVVVVDAATAIVRRDGRSLHDFLFDTKVVLDVALQADTARR